MDELYMEIYEKLFELQRMLHKHRMFHQMEHGPLADQTRGQGRVLAMLKIQPDMSTKDLAYLLGIRQQSLNELLNKLEKNDYIERTPSETDKRVMIIHLTEKGKNAQQPEQKFPNIFGDLNEEELRAFLAYLERITASGNELMKNMPEEELEEWMHHMRGHEKDERCSPFVPLHKGGPHGHPGCGRGPRAMHHEKREDNTI